MSYDIGAKISIEGEAAYRASIAALVASQKSLDAEMNATDAIFAKDSQAKERNAAQNRILKESIANAQAQIQLISGKLGDERSKLESLGAALEKTAAEHGANSAEAVKAQAAYNRQAASVSKLEAQLHTAEGNLASMQNKLKENEASAVKWGDVLKTAAGAAADFGAAVLSAMGSLGVAAIQAATAAVQQLGETLLSCATGAAEYADEIATLSITSGVSTEKLQELRYASDLIDVSVDTITGAMSRNIKSMAKGAEAYDQLGIAVTDADGNLRNSEEVFWEVIDALGEIPNETERDALAMELLGKSAKDLNPLIEAGSDRMSELADEAHRMGYVLDDEAMGALTSGQDALDRFSRATEGASNVIGSQVIPILGELAGAGTDVVGAFTKTLAETGDFAAAISAGGRVAEGLIDGLMEQGPQIADVMTTILGSLISTAAMLAPELVGVGLEFVSALLEGFVAALPRMIPAVVTGVTGVVTAIIGQIPAFLDAGGQLIGGLLEGIIELAPSLTESAGEILLQLIDGITSGAPDMIEAAVAIIEGLVDGLTSNIDQIIPAVVQMIITITMALIQHIPDLVSAAGQLVSGIARGLVTAIPMLIQAVPQIIASLVTGLFDSIPDLWQAGLDLVVGVGEGIRAGVDGLFDAGWELVQGLWQGISDAAGWLWEQVSGWCNGLIGGIKNMFGISSPSKETAWMGQMLVEGLAGGIEQYGDDAVKAAQGISEDVLSAMKTDLDGKLGNMAENLDYSATINRGPSVTEHRFSGTIRVEGVGSQGEFVASTDILIDQIVDALRMEARLA